MSSTIFRTRHHHSPRCASKTRYGSNLTGSTPPSVLELCPVTDTNKSMFSMLRSSVGQYVCGGNRLAVFGHVKPRFSHIEGLVLRLYGGNIACPVLPRARCRPYSTRNALVVPRATECPLERNSPRYLSPFPRPRSSVRSNSAEYRTTSHHRSELTDPFRQCAHQPLSV